MRKAIKDVLQLWAVVLALAGWSAAGVNIPDWVLRASRRPVATYAPETNAVVLLDEQEITILGPGEYQFHYLRVVRVLRPEGRNEGRLGLYFRGKDKVISIHAWSIDKSGRQYELKDKDFEERGSYSDFALYDDVRFRAALAPAADPGSVVAFEYELRRHDWLNQVHWFFQEDIPVELAQLTVQLPSAWEYKASWSGTNPVEPTKAGENCWQWVIKNVAAIEDEPRRPALLALSGRMELAYFGSTESSANSSSWKELGRWYAGLTADRRTPTPQISEKVKQLTAGEADFDARLRALAAFVQSQVRYVAIEIGIGGYQPHLAGDIFNARYGDCKDKATLLSTMLHETGIRSDYVLIDTERGTVRADAPSAWFNHAILAIELPSGRSTSYHSVVTTKGGTSYLIFDPTDPYTPIGELSSELQDSYALLVIDSGGELIRTPLLPAASNMLTRRGNFTLNGEGELGGVVVEDRSGDHARRERQGLAHSTEEQRSHHFERFLNRSLKGFTLQSTDIQHLDQVQNDLVLTYKFTSPQYAQIRGPLMLVRPRVLGEKSFEVETRKPRLYPIELEGSASQQIDTYEIEIPQGYAVDDVPEPVKIDVGFASYQSKIEVAGSRLRYWREYIVRDASVGPEHVADLLKFEGMIGADEEAAVVLKRAQ
jgi:transglutaminase-like putative cysteine protease